MNNTIVNHNISKLTVPITLVHTLSPFDKTSVASSTGTLDNCVRCTKPCCLFPGIRINAP